MCWKLKNKRISLDLNISRIKKTDKEKIHWQKYFIFSDETLSLFYK